MFLKSELLESNGSSVTLFQLSALQRIEYLEYQTCRRLARLVQTAG